MKSVPAFLLLLLAALPAWSDAPRCKLSLVAEWPVRFQGSLPTVEGSINGKKIGVLLDTGASVSAITKDAAERLDLITRRTGQYVGGFGGDSQVLDARVQEFRIGEAAAHNMHVRVIGERPLRGIDFILGGDFFHVLDMEFDYAKSTVRLFQAKDCKNAVLSYWDPNALQVPIEDEVWVVLDVALNGRTARTILDSGASGSVVSLPLAEKAGVTPQSPGVTSGRCSSGVGADLVHSWVARFDSVTVGGEKIRDPVLTFSDFTGDLGSRRNSPPELILGSDFLHAHRVYVARSQGKMYFTYSGGLVFPATPSMDCDERLGGMKAAEALAAYDKTLSEHPDDTKSRLGRAMLRIREKDVAGARADLDRVIEKEPGNAVALIERARLRASGRDYEGALVDSDAAIAHGMRTSGVYVARAQWRHGEAGCAAALAEYDQAVALDPREVSAVRGRGLCRLLLARYDGAIEDLTALTALRSNGFDALWLALARTRAGQDGRAVLEEALPRFPEGEWPRPLLLHALDRLDTDAVLAAAGSAEEARRQDRLCEARFFVAQDLITHGRRDDARPLLEAARDQCRTSYFEREVARAQLTP